MKVLCTHAAGLGELVAASLAEDLGGRVIYADDSAVLVATKASRAAVSALTYVKNSFVVIGSVPRRRDLGQSLEEITRALPGWRMDRARGPYRLMFSEDGQLVGVPPRGRSRLEGAVTRATGGHLAPRGGGNEYWVITRRDLDEVLFCRRTAGPQRRRPGKGELAPELAELIVRAAGPVRPTDVVLDPFAGSGALIAARLQRPLRQAICADLGYADGSVALAPDLARRGDVEQLSEDARTLASLGDDSVDVVVTDPPWGEYGQGTATDPAVLVGEALTAIGRVLRPDGAVAMLVARRMADEVGRHWRQRGFAVHRAYELLVNGHPTTLLVGGPDHAGG